MRSIALALALSLALVPAGAFAKAAACRDAKGHFAKCPPAAAAPAATSHMSSMSSSAMASMAAHPKNCKKGKPCGNTCISVKDVCHKPG